MTERIDHYAAAGAVLTEEMAAEAIRNAVKLGPFGPNSKYLIDRDMTVALTPGEAMDAARAVLALIRGGEEQC